MTHRDLSEQHLAILIDLYNDSFSSLDDLPYSQQFDVLHERFCERTGLKIDRHYVWKALCNCRKARKLTRKWR
jgi:hypothetical protein